MSDAETQLPAFEYDLDGVGALARIERLQKQLDHERLINRDIVIGLEARLETALEQASDATTRLKAATSKSNARIEELRSKLVAARNELKGVRKPISLTTRLRRAIGRRA